MTPSPPSDDFYIGYAPIPLSVRRFLLIFIPALVIVVLTLAALLPLVHFEQFNAGEVRGSQDFEGLLVGSPAPHLLVPQPEDASGTFPFAVYLLTGPGKTAPREDVLAQLGQWVTLTGTLVSRDRLNVIAARSAEPIPPPAAHGVETETSRSLGQFSLVGEIVDSKCYPGVMKPGRTKTHRACAIRCISGGVPPVFLVHNQDGNSLYFMLADEAGEAVGDRVLPVVADPLRITGEVMQYGDGFILKANPDTYERIG
ncbi:MAG: hypothetical protein AAFX78_14815 [Cyanobacteria bacterium J06638_20]